MPDLCSQLGFNEVVDTTIEIPSIRSGAHVKTILQQLEGYSTEDQELIAKDWNGTIEIKKLIVLAELAKQDVDSSYSVAERFLALRNSGVLGSTTSRHSSSKKK